MGTFHPHKSQGPVTGPAVGTGFRVHAWTLQTQSLLVNTWATLLTGGLVSALTGPTACSAHHLSVMETARAHLACHVCRKVLLK